ncbi:hypothetical protein HZB60_02500 [candidate division KSB1 bacterium]|nr:hypothetical protein [candidate division KSB1 bacterium]
MLALIVSRLAAMYSFYLYDDAFITFRFVENLVSGQGFLYNAGERVQGISTPLWGLVLAAPTAAGLRLVWSARTLGLLLDAVIALLVYRRLRDEGRARAATVAVGLFALDLFLAKTAVSGMESSLFLLMTMGAMLLLLDGRLIASAVIVAASVFVRPEGALCAAGMLGYAVVRKMRSPGRFRQGRETLLGGEHGLETRLGGEVETPPCPTVKKGETALRPVHGGGTEWQRLLAAAAVGFVIVTLGAVLQRWYYGTWIPQSVAGKMALPNHYHEVFTLALFPLRDPLQFVLTITTLVGLRSAWSASALVRVYTPWAVLLLLVWMITGAHLWAWYCVPIWFYKVVVTAVAAGVWVDAIRKPGADVTPPCPPVNRGESNGRPLPGTERIAIGAAVFIVTAWVGFAAAFGRDRMESNVYSKIREWVAGKSFTGMRAYGMDFGAFGYYTGLQILDEPGLVWPQAMTFRNDLQTILLAERPEYAFVTANQDNLRAMRGGMIAELYEPLWRASMNGKTDVLAPIESFVTDWAPDFYLFARRDLHAEK